MDRMEHSIHHHNASKPTIHHGQSFLDKKAVTPFFSPPVIQPKLTISAADDPYEREADAVAEKVMRMTDSETIKTQSCPVTIQTKCAACEEEELHRKADAEEKYGQLLISDNGYLLQRKCAECEQEERMHRKEATQGSVPSVSSSVYQTIQSPGMPMDAATRSFMESRFNYDFKGVRIHNDLASHQSAADIKAHAYTHGQHIAFAEGKYEPYTFSGKQLLAHELTHVVQQNTVHTLSGSTINRDEDKVEKPLTRYQEIEQSIDTPGEFEVIENPFGISIYNFAINRYYLKPEHKKILKKVARMLVSGKGFSLEVLLQGNTDSTGSPAVNNPLSVNRAKGVRNYLTELTGKKYKVEGEGEDLPITTNETYSGRSRNRRVDILIDHPSIHVHHDPTPPNGMILPPAYSYFVEPEIYREELLTDHKSCPWPWSCIDIPWIWPWFPIPKCVKLAAECAEGEDIEACYEFYQECIKGDDKNRRKACPVLVDLPTGNLPVHAEWPFLLLRDPFEMMILFYNYPENGCYCECGAYEQMVRGYFETEYKDGRVIRAKKLLTPGVYLEENTFHEDGDGSADSEYGHRSHPPRFNPDPDKYFIDRFIPTQQDGCIYKGIDNPGFGNGIAQHDEARRTWFLEFTGQPVDTCVEKGKRTPMEQFKHTWRIQGQIVAPPVVPKPVLPKGPGPGGGPGATGPKRIHTTPIRAKTSPSKGYPSAYGGGIDPRAKAGQEFDMSINFRVSGKSDIYSVDLHVKVIEPTNADIVTVETTNDFDVNVAPPGESEIVMKAHKKITIPRSIL
jgi:outer membrane protein OmpA-like peptidoglycan-associated protein